MRHGTEHIFKSVNRVCRTLFLHLTLFFYTLFRVYGVTIWYGSITYDGTQKATEMNQANK